MWSDLDRPPLRVAPLRRALVDGPGPWTELRVVARTPSTNADVAEAARAGAPEGLVIVAEEQTAGRGRLDRTWSAPARSSVMFSVLLRPDDVARSRWSWLPLVAGLAVVDALRTVAEVPAELKWPNDVLVHDRKVAGILAEVVGSASVLGIGLNVSLREDELPVPTATSLALAGAATTDRDTVLRAVLRSLATRYAQWRVAADAGDLPADYRAVCSTVGRRITVELPSGEALTATAVTVDEDGRLVVRGDDGSTTAVGAGDVVHVRPA